MEIYFVKKYSTFGIVSYFAIFISWDFDELFGDSIVDIKWIYNIYK